ncbi:MAG TPA: insulinase family protein [Ignavibacteriaceae bacterium]|nr:insulinase family protein [Ignavibacteriaceae bacterium]
MLKRHVNLLGVLLIIIIIFQYSVLNAQQVEKYKTQTLPKGVSIYQLDNGMQVLMIENPALPMVGVNVAVKVGSAYETFSTSGMSHMLEHLLFNGTTSRNQKQLYDDVDLIGGYNNASTAEFYTNFMMVTPFENIKRGMEIQSDMLFNSTLPLEKFEKEKGIVLEEISKSLAEPQEQLERNTISILFNGHSLSLPTLGTYSTIQSMSRDNVYSFYKNNYVPNNMILTVVGNFQSSSMLEMIKEIYGQSNPGLVQREINSEWKMGLQSPDFTWLNTKIVYYRFYEGEENLLQLFYELPNSSFSEYYDLINLTLGKNQNAIQDSLLKQFPLKVKSINLSTRLSPFKNFIEAKILLDNQADYNAVINSVSKILEGINFSLPSETIEAEAIKARTEFLKNIEKPHMFGIYNSNELVIKGIESVLASYESKAFFESAKELEFLKISSQPLVIIQSPGIKTQTDTLKASNDLKLFEDKSTGKSLIAVQNDVSDLLAIHYLIKHKAFYESKYGKDAAKILHDCFNQRLESEANKKISNKFGLTFIVNDNPYIPMDDIYLHPDFGYIRVEGLADDLTGAINYVNDQIKNFVPTEDEFNSAVEQINNIKMMTMGGDKAKQLFEETYKSLVYEPDQYSNNQIVLTYENLLAFAKEYFQPANMIVSVASPEDPESINNLFNNFNNEPLLEEPAVYSKSLILSQKETTIEKDGQGERSYLFWGFTKNIDPKDAPSLQALSLVLADDIIFDIREKQGMAYGMSAGIEVINDKALFYISQGTRPQNVDKLVPQYPKFFTLAAVDTLTEGELQKSINMYLGKMMFRRLSSINQAYYLANSLYFQNDFNYDKTFLENLKNVKLSDVKEAAKKYMQIKNPVFVIIR